MKVRDLMTTPVQTCRKEDSLAAAARLLFEHDCGCLPVVDDEGRPRGIITDRDICMGAYDQARDLAHLRVGDSMTQWVAACNPGDDLSEAGERMAMHQVRRLLVVDHEGRLSGVLSLHDIARAVENLSRPSTDQAAVVTLKVITGVCRRPRTREKKELHDQSGLASLNASGDV